MWILQISGSRQVKLYQIPTGVLINPDNLGESSNRQYISGTGYEIAQNKTICLQEELSLTKGVYVIFDLNMTGLSKNWHHIIEISEEVLAPDGTGLTT